jgi:hypothetical protein
MSFFAPRHSFSSFRQSVGHKLFQGTFDAFKGWLTSKKRCCRAFDPFLSFIVDSANAAAIESAILTASITIALHVAKIRMTGGEQQGVVQ